MPTFRRNPWFVLALVLAAIAFIAEGGWLYLSSQAAARAEIKIRTKQRELLALERVSPKPNQSVAQAIAEDVLVAENAFAELQGTLRGGAAAELLLTAKIPVVRTDAYFDLIAYRQDMRAAAKEHGVSIAADESFGFTAFANEGPEKGVIPVVFQQRQVLTYLLKTLFAAHPVTLKQVLRSVPDHQGASGQRATLTEGDYFALPSLLSVRKPGFVRTLGFQIEFSGETVVLRKWLNRLAEYDLPIVVRSIEVEPSRNRESTRSDRDVSGPIVLNDAAGMAVPLVQRLNSNFKVVVEYVELVPMPERSEP